MNGRAIPFDDQAVKAVFDGFVPDVKDMALHLRALIFETAARTPQVGQVQEALRWGQPAYLTPQTKSGSTLRVGPAKKGGCVIFAHCQTQIIPNYVAQFPGLDEIDGTRAVIFKTADDIDPIRVRFLIHHALCYHL